MSLTDRTNETIPLSQHDRLKDDSGGWWPAELNVDVDHDSSFTPSEWVDICWIDEDHDSDRIKLTFEEAGKLHDRLGLILGRVSLDRADLHIPHGPVGVDENKADAEYLRSAADRWRTRKVMGFNLTVTVAGVLEKLAAKLEGSATA